MKETGNLPDENSEKTKDSVNEEDNNSDKPKILPKKDNASKLADVGPKTKFLGFHRLNENSNWSLHPQMLASEDSVINKITLMHGECDIHIINIELPK